MSLDLSKLEKVRQAGEKTQARCPACAEIGKDTDGDNLTIFPGGAFVCTAHQGDKIHSKRIHELAGEGAKPSPQPKRTEVDWYDYQDEQGNPLFQVVRYHPKDFRQRHKGPNGEWVWSIKGVRQVPFSLPSLIRAAVTRQRVFITEGEKDAKALQKAGLVATCNAGGAGKWSSEFGQYLRDADVVILPDKDDPGRRHAEDVATKLEAFAASIRVVELPGKATKDPADFLELGGTAEQITQLANATPLWTRQADTLPGNEDEPELKPTIKPRNFPPPVEFSEWIVKEIPDRPEIIRGLLRHGDKMTIGGASKSKKTWFVSALALCVSAGRPWLGMPTNKTRVLFINLELQEKAFHSRMTAIREALGIRHTDSSLAVWNLRGERAAIESLQEDLEHHRGEFGMIVFDPLYKILGKRKENAAEDMADLLGILEQIASDHDAAIVIPAHYSKGNQSEKESIDRISGSGVFARDADCIMSLTAHEQAECFTRETVLRSYAPIPSVVLRWEYPLFHEDSELDPAKLRRVVGAKQRHDRDAFVALLGTDGLTLPQWVVEAKKLGMGKTTVYDLKDELIEKKKIIIKPGSNPSVFIPKKP